MNTNPVADSYRVLEGKEVVMAVRFRSASIAVMAVCLTACGGGSGDDDADPRASEPIVAGEDTDEQANSSEVPPGPDVPKGEVRGSHFSGYVGIEESDDIAIATFSRADRAPEVFEMDEDSCLPFATDIVSFTPDASKVRITAGESVVISGPGGTYATLPLEEGDPAFPSYRQGDLPVGPDSLLPDSLVLNTTGDGGFPSSMVEIPDAENLVLVEPVESQLSSGVFRWIPSATNDDDIVVRIGYGDDSRSYTCRATDDGYFELPEDVATASDGTRTFVGVYRERTNVIVEPRISWFARRTHGVFLFD